MTKDLYDTLTPKEKAIVMIFKEQQKTNQILQAILKADG